MPSKLPKKPAAKKKTVAKAPKKNSKNKAAGKKPLSKYFDFDPSTATFTLVSGKRPTNQNRRGVVTKTSKKIAQVFSKANLRDTTRSFQEGVSKKVPLSQMNSGVGLQMAHVRSADEWKHTLAEVMNMTSSKNLKPAKRKKVVNNFIETTDGYISSDAEDSDRKRVRTASKVVADPHAAPKQRAQESAYLLDRLSKTSRMLVGADPSTNMWIQSRQDLPTTRDGKVFPYSLKRSRMLDSLQDDLGMAHEEIPKKKAKTVSSTMDYT